MGEGRGSSALSRRNGAAAARLDRAGSRTRPGGRSAARTGTAGVRARHAAGEIARARKRVQLDRDDRAPVVELSGRVSHFPVPRRRDRDSQHLLVRYRFLTLRLESGRGARGRLRARGRLAEKRTPTTGGLNSYLFDIEQTEPVKVKPR